MINDFNIVTGDTGLIGTALCRSLDKNRTVRCSEIPEIIQNLTSTFDLNKRNRLNLANDSDAADLFYYSKCKFEIETKVNYAEQNLSVFHLAAKVGGINANISNLGDFYRENILINTNVLECARLAKVKKVVSLASTCVYPDGAALPLKECDLHKGEPHFSNYGYAYAKRMLDVQSRTYRDQYGCNFVVAIPTNCYGESDNYDLQNGHAIPVLIHKIFLAKKEKRDKVELYGSGKELRDFIYSKDLAKALILVKDSYNEKEPINIASGKETRIKDVAEMICFYIGYNGKIAWNQNLSGQFRKPVDTSKIENLNWKPSVSISEGLKASCTWFLENYPKVRGAAKID